MAVTATAAATTFLTKKIVQGTNETATYGNEVDKMSQKLGLSAKAYQEWDYVLSQADVDIQSMQTGLKTLTNQIDDAKNGSADAAARFEKLGISLDDLNTMSREDIFAATIKGFQGMADSTERAALANDLYGKSGQNLTPLFNETAEATDELRQKAHELGMVMSDEAVEASAAYNDSLDTLQRTTTGLKNNLMAEFLPSITTVMDGLSNIFSGNDKTGLGQVSKGIDDFIKNLNKKLPSIIKTGGKIIVQLVKAVAQNLPKLIDSGTEAIMSFAQGILQNLPQIVQSGVQILLSLVKGIANNVKQIVGTVINVVVEIAKALTNPRAISEIIKAGFKIITELASGILEGIPQLLAAVPDIIGGLVEGIISGLGGVNNAIMGFLTGAGSRIARYSQQIADQVAGIESFRDAMANLTPTLADYDKLLSQSGKTLSQLDDSISEVEGNITTILQGALEEQRGLREDEIEEIRQYLDDMNSLYQEKLEIYRSQQTSELKKLQLELDTLDKDTAKQRLKNAEEALKQANDATEQAYSARLTQIENYYRAEGTLGSTAYQKELDDAKKAHDDAIAENESYYNQMVDTVAQKTEEWVSVDSSKWAMLSEHLDQFNVHTGTAMNDNYRMLADWLGLYSNSQAEYAQILSTMDLDTAQAFLEMQTEIANRGEDIGEESRQVAANILGAFDNLPENMDATGKDALLGMIKGLEAYIPSLENASEMTADEIVDTIKSYLGIASPSTVLREVGVNSIKGLIQGEESQKSPLQTSSRGIVDSMKKVFTDSQGSFNTIGGQLSSGLGRGFAAQKDSLLSKIKGVLSSVISTAKKVLGIASPSKVFAEIGENMMKGVGVGWDDEIGNVQKDIVDGMNDLVDSADVPFDFGGGDYEESIVSRETGATGGFGAQIVAALDEYFPELIDTITQLRVYLDTGALVGELTPSLDRSLGQESVYRVRAN